MDAIQPYIDIYVTMWKNYSNFNDRSTRKGYWIPALINAVAAYLISLIGISILSNIFSLALFLPGIALCVRRLNDVGHTWKYIFIALIPLAGPILLLVALVQPSVPADGRATI